MEAGNQTVHHPGSRRLCTCSSLASLSKLSKVWPPSSFRPWQAAMAWGGGLGRSSGSICSSRLSTAHLFAVVPAGLADQICCKDDKLTGDHQTATNRDPRVYASLADTHKGSGLR